MGEEVPRWFSEEIARQDRMSWGAKARRSTPVHSRHKTIRLNLHIEQFIVYQAYHNLQCDYIGRFEDLGLIQVWWRPPP